MLKKSDANVSRPELRLVDPPFGSHLNTVILDLDYLRRKRVEGTTCREIFSQLKDIFHILESVGSARIEGNRTTLTEYVERKIEGGGALEDEILEIKNNEKALDFIDENISHEKISRAFLSEIHKMITAGLQLPPHGEGSRNPGNYRTVNVTIARSAHSPPDASQVAPLMNELLDFINKDDPPQYDLLKVAIAHHRFAWIHPFDNGNGRVVRLLTYAMLVKYGFKVDIGGRIINPTAVFCSDRERYYEQLAMADRGAEEHIAQWCEYVLSGLREEITKIDRLLDYEFLKKKILLPTIQFALERQYITDDEFKILREAAKKQVIMAGDVKHLFEDKQASGISRLIRGLKKKKMLRPVEGGSRKYILMFENNYLLRGIIRMLDKEAFLAFPVD